MIICLFGVDGLKQLGFGFNDLSSCDKTISVAGGSSIQVTGAIKLLLLLNNRTSLQTVYFSSKADRFFLGRQACIELNIVPKTYPYPPDVKEELMMTSLVKRPTFTPRKPKELPCDPLIQNIPELKKYLMDQFADTAFNKNHPFPKLSTPSARIHLRPNYVRPKPAFWPATVAEHWAEEVKAGIDKDVAAGVLTPVPFNESTEWCARMVIVRKHNGSPRRTVDYQQLNAQCLREPNYSESPFHTCRKVPQGTWKSTFDAVDGYHSVEIDTESSKLTTFITPWGRYRYLRFPQGHCSAGDAFVGFRPSLACLGLGVGGTLTESDIVASLNELYWNRKHPRKKATTHTEARTTQV